MGSCQRTSPSSIGRRGGRSSHMSRHSNSAGAPRSRHYQSRSGPRSTTNSGEDQNEWDRGSIRGWWGERRPGTRTLRGWGKGYPLGLVIGVIGLGLVIIGATIDPRQAAFSYLMAFIFWHTIAFGALVHLMIQHAINASWAIVLRRVGEGVATTFPILLILALPLTIGLDLIFPWTEPVGALPDHPDLRARIVHRGAYLNTTLFYLRAGAYFAVWILIAWLLQRWTLRQFEMDGGPGGPRGRSLAQAQRVLSALTLPLMAFVITFAAIDWVMSLEPEWSSTILGVYYYAGSALAFTAVLTLLSLAVQ